MELQCFFGFFEVDSTQRWFCIGLRKPMVDSCSTNLKGLVIYLESAPAPSRNFWQWSIKVVQKKIYGVDLHFLVAPSRNAVVWSCRILHFHIFLFVSLDMYIDLMMCTLTHIYCYHYGAPQPPSSPQDDDDISAHNHTWCCKTSSVFYSQIRATHKIILTLTLQ